MRRRLLGMLTLVFASACGGAVQHFEVSSEIAVTIVPAVDSLPFDARGAHLLAASQQLAQLAGHPVTIQIDAALVPEIRAEFERQLIDGIEQLARDLVEWKRTRPDAFSRSAALVRRVEYRYRATTVAASSALDPATGVLRIDLPAHPRSLASNGTIVEALDSEDAVYRERRFGGRTPDSIAPSDRRAYFGYLVRTPHQPSSRDGVNRTEAAKVADSQFADAIAHVVHLADLTKQSDVELTKNVRAWLLHEARTFFYNAYKYHGREIATLGTRTRFHAAEIVYGRWLATELPRASATERYEVSRELFVGDADAFPGLDRFAFGLDVVDAWIRAGRPLTEGAEDPEGRLFDEILCPSARDKRGNRRRDHGCNSAQDGWAALVAMDEGYRRRLAQALDARDNGDLADQLLFTLSKVRMPGNSLAGGKADFHLELLHLLNPRLRSYRAGIFVVALEFGPPLVEGARMWSAAPDQRGTALYLLGMGRSSISREFSDDQWREFPVKFGAAIDRPLLAAMLDYGPTAFNLVPRVWPALAPRFSRMDVVLPHIDEAMPDASASEAAEPLRALLEITSRLCQEANSADLAKLHAYLARRTVARPSEGPALEMLERDTAPGGCRLRAGKSKRASDVP